MTAVENIDHLGHVPVLGDGRSDCHRRRLEREHRRGGGQWGNDKLVADGLGAYIAQVTEKGDKRAIYFSIVVMAMFVVFINRVFWRRLYDLAERRFRLD